MLFKFANCLLILAISEEFAASHEVFDALVQDHSHILELSHVWLYQVDVHVFGTHELLVALGLVQERNDANVIIQNVMVLLNLFFLGFLVSPLFLSVLLQHFLYSLMLSMAYKSVVRLFLLTDRLHYTVFRQFVILIISITKEGRLGGFGILKLILGNFLPW